MPKRSHHTQPRRAADRTPQPQRARKKKGRSGKRGAAEGQETRARRSTNQDKMARAGEEENPEQKKKQKKKEKDDRTSDDTTTASAK